MRINHECSTLKKKNICATVNISIHFIVSIDYEKMMRKTSCMIFRLKCSVGFLTCINYYYYASTNGWRLDITDVVMSCLFML